MLEQRIKHCQLRKPDCKTTFRTTTLCLLSFTEPPCLLGLRMPNVINGPVMCYISISSLSSSLEHVLDGIGLNDSQTIFTKYWKVGAPLRKGLQKEGSTNLLILPVLYTGIILNPLFKKDKKPIALGICLLLAAWRTSATQAAVKKSKVALNSGKIFCNIYIQSTEKLNKEKINVV